MKRPTLRMTLAAGVTMIALASFTILDKPYRQPLKVERQQWTLQHMVGSIPSEDFDIGITIDVPVSGTSILIDSVMHLLNEALYAFLEHRETPYYSPEEVYCSDGKHLLQHYRKAYTPFLVDTCEFRCCFPDFDYLRVTMVEQTDSFVTCEVSSYFIGEGDCNYLKWVTFDKRDGHRLSKVINDEDVPDLLKTTGYDVAWRFNFGLTADTLRCQYFLAPGIVETFTLDMKSARPYLTEEAKRLLK